MGMKYTEKKYLFCLITFQNSVTVTMKTGTRVIKQYNHMNNHHNRMFNFLVVFHKYSLINHDSLKCTTVSHK